VALCVINCCTGNIHWLLMALRETIQHQPVRPVVSTVQWLPGGKRLQKLPGPSFWVSFSNLASLPTVVVLPAPAGQPSGQWPVEQLPD
jgi:hypothetical protein